jgi:hypothetical protein
MKRTMAGRSWLIGSWASDINTDVNMGMSCGDKRIINWEWVQGCVIVEQHALYGYNAVIEVFKH